MEKMEHSGGPATLPLASDAAVTSCTTDPASLQERAALAQPTCQAADTGERLL